MSVRRDTKNRLNLIRACGTCGKSFSTTADSPWMRQVLIDGKQKTRYFCSQTCFRASYKYKGYWDGLTRQRREQSEAMRDHVEKTRLYYQRNVEQERARAKARYWADPEAARESNRYQYQKRKLLAKEVSV